MQNNSKDVFVETRKRFLITFDPFQYLVGSLFFALTRTKWKSRFLTYKKCPYWASLDNFIYKWRIFKLIYFLFNVKVIFHFLMPAMINFSFISLSNLVYLWQTSYANRSGIYFPWMKNSRLRVKTHRNSKLRFAFEKYLLRILETPAYINNRFLLSGRK